MDSLCKIYVKMRDKKQELVREHDAQVAELDAKMQSIASAMKDLMTSLGTSSMKTAHGTAYLQHKTRYYPMDWSLFGAWIVENNAIDLLEKRVAQGNMKEWIAANPTKAPPGVQADTEVTVTVRKA
jgi:hypothetical protein